MALLKSSNIKKPINFHLSVFLCFITFSHTKIIHEKKSYYRIYEE